MSAEQIARHEQCRQQRVLAASMIEKSNAGPLHCHSVREVIALLECLPMNVRARAEFAGVGFWRDEYTPKGAPGWHTAEALLIERIDVIEICGCRFTHYAHGGEEWDYKGLVFARDDAKRMQQHHRLQRLLDLNVAVDSSAESGELTKEIVREALIEYAADHNDGDVLETFYQDGDGQLVLRDGHHDDEASFEDLMPLTLKEATELFLQGDCHVIESYDW